MMLRRVAQGFSRFSDFGMVPGACGHVERNGKRLNIWATPRTTNRLTAVAGTAKLHCP